MTDDAADGRPWPIDPIPTPPTWEASAGSRVGRGPTTCRPRWPTSPVTANGSAPADPAPADRPEEPVGVTDEDRNRYGLLLDRAAERGLLSTDEYEVRLGELAEATSIDQMQQIVTELPVFTAAGGHPPTGSRRPAAGRRPSPVMAVGEPAPVEPVGGAR